MTEAIRLLFGYTIVLYLEKTALVNGQLLKFLCKESKANGKLSYDCSNLQQYNQPLKNIHYDFIILPSDLDVNVEHLDLSNNDFARLEAMDIQKYVHLTRLNFYNSNISGNVDVNVFKSLEKLQDLDLSGVRYITDKTWKISKTFSSFNWPTSLKIFNIANTGQEELILTKLPNLEIVNASKNLLKQFPQFDKDAPLHSVFVDSNPFNELKCEQLVPYCNLKTLSMKVELSSSLLTAANYCNCLRLNLFTKKFGINATTLECKQNGEVVCDTEFGENILTERSLCPVLQSDPQKSSKWILWILIPAIILILLLIFLLLFAYRYATKNAQESDENSLSSDASGIGNEGGGMEEAGEEEIPE